MMSSVDEARANVETEYKRALEIAEAGGQLAGVESQLWTQMLALGRAMIALYFVHHVNRLRAGTYEHEGRMFELSGSITNDIGTRFGKVAFRRPTARPVGRPRGRRDFPVDRELGIASASAFRRRSCSFDCALRWPSLTRARRSRTSSSGRRVHAQSCEWWTASAITRPPSWSKRPRPRTTARSSSYRPTARASQ